MIRFFNIRNGEELQAETEPQISALWFSSDKGPNAMQGQDFGWRLAPEVVVEMQAIMSDRNKLQEIANNNRMMLEDVRDTDVLTYISDKTDRENAPIADMSDFTDAYNEAIKKLRVRAVTEAERAEASRQAAAQQPTESLADMEKRVKLAERLAKANAIIANPSVGSDGDGKATSTSTET